MRDYVGRAFKYLRRLHSSTRDEIKQIHQDTALRGFNAYKIKPGSLCSSEIGESVSKYILIWRQ